MKIRNALNTGVLVVACLLFGGAALAEPNPECVRDATQNWLLCRAVCRESFQVDKDLCRNIDHDCADACRSGLEACLDGPDGPLTRLETCRNDCLDTLENAKQSCRNSFPEGTTERDQCIDTAQLAAFSCRDTCREGVREDIAQCRRSFRACIVACPSDPD